MLYVKECKMIYRYVLERFWCVDLFPAFEIPLKGNVGVWVPHPESCVSSDMMGDTEFERLLSLEREDPDLWTRVKKNRDAEVWKRNGEVYTPIHKVKTFTWAAAVKFSPC